MDNNNLKKQNRLMKKPVPKTPEERSETEEIILDNFCGCYSVVFFSFRKPPVVASSVTKKPFLFNSAMVDRKSVV